MHKPRRRGRTGTAFGWQRRNRGHLTRDRKWLGRMVVLRGRFPLAELAKSLFQLVQRRRLLDQHIELVRFWEIFQIPRHGNNRRLSVGSSCFANHPRKVRPIQLRQLKLGHDYIKLDFTQRVTHGLASVHCCDLPTMQFLKQSFHDDSRNRMVLADQHIQRPERWLGRKMDLRQTPRALPLSLHLQQCLLPVRIFIIRRGRRCVDKLTHALGMASSVRLFRQRRRQFPTILRSHRLRSGPRRDLVHALS